MSFFKLVYQNKNELPATSMAFTVIVSRIEKKSLPSKILSSFALTAQPYQNIVNRSDCYSSPKTKSLDRNNNDGKASLKRKKSPETTTDTQDVSKCY